MASSARRCSAVGSGKGRKERIPEVEVGFEINYSFKSDKLSRPFRKKTINFHDSI